MNRVFATLVVFFALCAAAVAQPARPDILEVISLRGEISEGMAASVAKQVEEINRNPRVKAVLLEVDSPGGGVLASAAIYDELSKLKVPVEGWCDNICASGGMYALMAPTVKHIGVRTDVTISGSIGVIATYMRFHRLLEHFRIDSTTYKSGSRKDEGNPMRAPTEADHKNIQAEIDELAEKFYAVVDKGRAGKITDWAEIKTARIFFGEAGVKVGLVDAVMNRDAAIAKAKELSGSKNICTRDELKEMSKQAEKGDHYLYTAPPAPTLADYARDIAFAIETVRELKEGSFYRVEYRFPGKY